MNKTASLLLWIALVCAAAPSEAKNRDIVPVPAWNALDGIHWGALVIGETARADFERDYSCRDTNLSGVLRANTSSRTKTEAFVVFDGPGPAARLAWVVCFYDSGRGAPTPLEFEGRFGDKANGGYLPIRQADWRLRVAPEQGVAAVIERGEERERVAALISGRPDPLAAFASGLSARETEIESLLAPEDREPLLARFAAIDVNVDVDRGVNVDRRRLKRELERAAEGEAGQRSCLRFGGRAGGRLALSVDVEPHRKREQDEIRITTRATLDAEGPYGIVSVRSGDYTRDLDSTSSESQVQREARRLVEQVIDSVAGTAQSQLEQRRSKALSDAQRKARLSLVAALMSSTTSAGPR